MSSSTINNVTAPDSFTDAATWRGATAEAFVVTVANDAIVLEIGVGQAGISWAPSADLGPHFLIPGVHTLPGGDGVRFHNAVAGAVAQVSVRAAPGKQLEGAAYASLSGLQVTPAGTVAYDFDGHVHAAGLDLDAGATGAPPNDRRIRWLRTTDGAVIADLYGYVTDDTHSGAHLEAATVAGAGNVQLNLLPSGANGLHSRLQASVTGFSGNKTADILDSDGQSNFLQAGVGAATETRLWGPYSKSVSGVGAGAVQDFVTPALLFDPTAMSAFHVFGLFDMTNGGDAWMDYCTWSLISLNSPNSFTFRVHNGGAGATQGHFKFCCLTTT